MNRKTIIYLLLSFISLSMPLSAADKKIDVDVKEIVLGHMADAYEWHITTYKGHSISIPLPIIV